MFYINYIIYEFKTIKDIVYIKFIFLIQQYISKCGIPSYITPPHNVLSK